MTPQELEAIKQRAETMREFVRIDREGGKDFGTQRVVAEAADSLDDLVTEVQRLQRFENAFRDPVWGHLRTPLDRWLSDPGCPSCGKPMESAGPVGIGHRFVCSSGIEHHWLDVSMGSGEVPQIDAPYASEGLDRTGWWPPKRVTSPQA